MQRAWLVVPALLLTACSRSGWEGELLDGNRHGEWKRWKDGAVAERARYEKGKLHGRRDVYEDGGTQVSHYWRGQPHGVFAVNDIVNNLAMIMLEGEPVASADWSAWRTEPGPGPAIWPKDYVNGRYTLFAHGTDSASPTVWKVVDGVVQNGWPHGRWTVWKADGVVDERLTGLYEHGRRMGR